MTLEVFKFIEAKEADKCSVSKLLELQGVEAVSLYHRSRKCTQARKSPQKGLANMNCVHIVVILAMVFEHLLK